MHTRFAPAAVVSDKRLFPLVCVSLHNDTTSEDMYDAGERCDRCDRVPCNARRGLVPQTMLVPNWQWATVMRISETPTPCGLSVSLCEASRRTGGRASGRAARERGRDDAIAKQASTARNKRGGTIGRRAGKRQTARRSFRPEVRTTDTSLSFSTLVSRRKAKPALARPVARPELPCPPACAMAGVRLSSNQYLALLLACSRGGLGLLAVVLRVVGGLPLLVLPLLDLPLGRVVGVPLIIPANNRLGTQ